MVIRGKVIDIVKITYYVKSKKVGDKYYTSAIIEKISICEKWTRQFSTDELLDV
jgi:hypothetical protein